MELHGLTDSEDFKPLEKERKTENDIRKAIIRRLGDKEPNELVRLSKPDRDAMIRKLRDSGLSIRQIERATGVPKGVIVKC